MKPLLNTLFVTAEGAYVSRDGDQVVVSVEREERLRLPIHTIEAIVCIGHPMVTPGFLGLAAEHGVCVSFLGESGRFMARVEGPVRGNVLLRREQYRRTDNPVGAAAIARAIVIAKIANGRTVLQRALRDHGVAPRLEAAVEELARCAERFQDRHLDLETIRGREGEAAAIYFGAFDDLIVSQKEDFRFYGRTRRPPLDPVNALLSFLYTLLVHDVRSALEAVGLDPAVGFLHRERPGRPSLALDLMEEFRPLLADRMALTLINRQQVTARDFCRSDSGGWVLEERPRRDVLKAWQERKQDEITHPFLGERMPMGLIPHMQARLLARHLRGDYDAYPAFVWK